LFVIEAKPAVLLLKNTVTPVSLLMMFTPVGRTVLLVATAALAAVAPLKNPNWPSADTVKVGAGDAGSTMIPELLLMPVTFREVEGRAKLKVEAPAENWIAWMKVFEENVIDVWVV
jgi:hypothetical protein